MKSLTREIAQSLPAGLTLPAEFASAIDWMEDAGAVERSRDGKRFAVIDPCNVGRMGGSQICIHAAEAENAQAWTRSTDSALNRLAIIFRTGGDGSMAGLWRDDAGDTQIVHLGSGSGSVSVGIMTRSPLDFLRLLAIGYEEICWPESYAAKPIDVSFDRETFRVPVRFRHWLTTTFNTDFPETAASLVLPMGEIGKPGDDPFCQWIEAISS